MIVADLRLSSIDLASVRFQTSYAQEIALSVRVLQHDPTGLHRAWARTTRERLAAHPELDLAVLAALVPANGFLADILTPTLATQPRDVTDELGAVAALDPALLARDAETLLDLSPSRTAAAVLRDLQSDPAAGLERVVAAMDAYWQVTLADHWDTIRRVLDADIAQRSRRIGSHGLGPLLHDLSSRVRVVDGSMRVEASCRGDDILDGGRGLVLTPSVFCEPRGLIALNEPFVPTIIYHALGVGNLWSSQEVAADHALDDALGRTHAQLLRAIGVPATTTELAGQLGLSAATVSEHLAILRRAGLTDPRRDGRTVLYGRTAAADTLLRAAAG